MSEVRNKIFNQVLMMQQTSCIINPEFLFLRLTAAPGEIVSNVINIKSGGSFGAEGLNIAYVITDNDTPPLIQMQDQDRGIPFMNTRIPVDLLSTPGRRGATQAESGIRFGEKKFTHLFSSNSTFYVEIENPSTNAAAVTVDVMLSGTRYKV